MWIGFKTSAAIAALLVARSITAQAAPTDAVPTTPVCTYRDAHYGPGALICVAPKVGQICGDDGHWVTPTQSFREACANAQIPVPGAPTPAPAPASSSSPTQCKYHDVTYAEGAMICVAPRFGQTCTSNGSWSPFSSDKDFKTACENAQIPAPASASGNPGSGPAASPPASSPPAK
jgi:hypothetical protein